MSFNHLVFIPNSKCSTVNQVVRMISQVKLSFLWW